MSTLPYEIVDVFTDRPFTGNPLAVVFDATELGTDQLQTLAREFHLSETVFILPPTVPGATYRARIFTVEEELPFAGHPSLGAALTLLRRGAYGPGLVHQECGAGVLPIEVEATGRATLTGGVPFVGPEVDPGPLLAAVGLVDDDFVGPAPRLAGCGLNFPFLSVRPEAVARAQAGPAGPGAANVTVFSWDPVHRTAHTRVFVPGSGVPEDPATGSSALGFGVWLVASGLLPDDEASSYVVRQGVELHRPSILDCVVTASMGIIERVTVSGSVVPIATGEIGVPPFVG